MIDLSQARLTTLAMHKVGNKLKQEGVLVSDSLFPLDDEMLVQSLEDYFLKPFKAEEFFKFIHGSDLNLNEVYTYCRTIFEQPRTEFLAQSMHLLNHLYDQSVHPHIKSGEFYVAHFRECLIDEQPLEAIGLFKSEHKDAFLQPGEAEERMQLSLEEGVDIKKLDKGCLIFNTYAEDGYSVLMVDRNSEDTQYWRDDFLHVDRIQDNSFQTEKFLTFTKDYVSEVFSREQDKKDQVVFLNKSLNYFNKNEVFDVDSYKEEVLPTPEQQEPFDDSRRQYETDEGMSPAEEGFQISRYAVRSMKKLFKSIIKLDTEVEIKLNPKKIEEVSENVERGFDDHRGMFYYKIYFNEELE